jgi:ribosomal protein L37AE/L43A
MKRRQQPKEAALSQGRKHRCCCCYSSLVFTRIAAGEWVRSACKIQLQKPWKGAVAKMMMMKKA